MGGLIPTKNASALTGYYCAVFSVIPCLGLVLGGIALILGFRGLSAYRAAPAVRGRTHALVAIILGGLMFVLNLGFLVFVALSRN
jgi:hypothetical protein